MNSDLEERQLRGFFHDLRQEDERLAPPFARDWEATTSRMGRRGRPWRVFQGVAAATAVLIAAGVSTIILRSLRPSAPDISITRWRSPTALLLRSPADPLLKTGPRLGGSLEDIRAVTPGNPDGGAK